MRANKCFPDISLTLKHKINLPDKTMRISVSGEQILDGDVGLLLFISNIGWGLLFDLNLAR